MNLIETKRIEMLQKRCDLLQEDNKELSRRNRELEGELKNLHGIIEAADSYAEEHHKAMRLAAESRERYELAYKQMLKLKKEYEQRMVKVLKGLE